MFVLRFIKHGGNGYRSFSCDKYEVNADATNSVKVTMFTQAAEQSDEGPTSYVTEVEYVGPTDPYDLAYVTNEAGKTVDTVRHRLSGKRID